MKRYDGIRAFAAPLFALLIALSGCSTAPLAPESPATVTTAASGDATASNGSLLPTTSLVVSKTINGLLGGVITAGDWSVQIPAGSFAGVGVVTITVPDPTVRKCDLDIVPSLLNNFRVPVTLSARLPTVTETQTSVMMWWDPSAKVWREIPSTADPTTRTRQAKLSHFSTYGCGKAGW